MLPFQLVFSAVRELARHLQKFAAETINVDSGFYAACAGLKARTQALEVVAYNLANITTNGYSSAQVDQRKVGKLALAIQVAFQELGVFPASSNTIALNTNDPVPLNTVQAIENAERSAALGRVAPTSKGILGASENGDLSSLRQELMDALAPEIQRNEVAVTVGPDGLIVSLKEIGFFDRGSAQIRPSSLSPFSRIAWLLADRKYRLRIEGHTDNRPIHNAQFSDNWELSTARASGLVRLLIVKYGFAPERLSAAGYAEYHPVSQNTSTDGRAQNRRVDIVILGKLSPDQPLRALRTPLPPDQGANPVGSASDSQSITGTPKPSAAIPSTGSP